MKSEKLSNLFTAVLTVCALVVTGAVVRREFFSPPASETFPHPRVLDDWKELDHSGNLLGSVSAPVRIVEFADYECPFCRALNVTLDQLKERYPGRIAVVYRQYPLPIHPYALSAAIAAECAAVQHQFAPYHALLFQLQDSLGVVKYDTIASRAGVSDISAFDSCLKDPSIALTVSRDADAAKRIGVKGTPAMVVRNQLLGGALPLDSIDAWIHRVQPDAFGNK